MPRAYEPGERWPTQTYSHGSFVAVSSHNWVGPLTASQATLIAESLLRDELLREVEVLLRFVAEENGAVDLLTRIRETLERTA